MRGLAIGAIAAVVLVMLAAITLLPAMLGFAGRAIDKLAFRACCRAARSPSARGFWYRWSRTVQRRPACWPVPRPLVLLVCLAIPLFSMRLAFTDAGNDPAQLTTRQAFDALATGFGPGFNGPLIVVARVPARPARGGRRTSTPDRRHPRGGVREPRDVQRLGDAALIIAYPTTSPQSSQTETLVHHCATRSSPRPRPGPGWWPWWAARRPDRSTPPPICRPACRWVISAVLLLSFLFLMAVFRSMAIPLKAVIVNLLSVGAAYGVIVAVFQWGWLGGLFGIGATGPIDPWIPLMMFTILFGLSMDYEVFLLSRMREEWLRTGDNSSAVADGLAKTARVITAAAAIMICVFGSFVIGDPLHVLKVFGLGLAAAILIDATLVRMVLVPSIMELLGDANWWMPRGSTGSSPASGSRWT